MEKTDPTNQVEAPEPMDAQPEENGSSQDSVDEIVTSDETVFIPTKKPKRYEIFNKTPRRIAIKTKESDDAEEPEYLAISPFSTKVLSEDALPHYETHRWEQEDLIDIKEISDPSDDGLAAQGYAVGCGFWLLVYVVVAMLVPILRLSIYTWIVFGLFVIVTFLMIIGSSEGEGSDLRGKYSKLRDRSKRVGRGIMKIVNLVLFLLVVFGLGIGLLYMFSGGREWLGRGEFTLEGLGRVIQYVFVIIATLLPALMYFLFNRGRREKVQDNFIREILRLDPGIRSITEAESKYLSQVQEAFGTSHTSAFLFSSGLPILLSTLLIFMGWVLVLQPFNESSLIDIQQLESLLMPRSNAVTFAFLGSYFFAISMVFRGYVRADLTPKTYMNIILRLLLAVILAWTLAALPVFTAAGSGEEEGFSTGLLYLVAFFIGIFPETGLAAIKDLARNPFFTRMFPRLEEDHPLTHLDGINLYDRSRFMEEGIENVENLAHHNLIGLMLSTRISTNRLVDMFDQAILYLHLGLEPNDVADTRKKLRAYGIRTATDMEAAHDASKKRKGDEHSKFLMILDSEKADPKPLSRVHVILDTLRDDDWMTYLRNWRELSQQSTQTFTLKGVNLVPLDEHGEKAIKMAY